MTVHLTWFAACCHRGQWPSHAIPSSISEVVLKGVRSQWYGDSLPLVNDRLEWRPVTINWKLNGHPYHTATSSKVCSQTFPSNNWRRLSCPGSDGFPIWSFHYNANHRLVVEIYKPRDVANWPAIGGRHNLHRLALVFCWRLQSRSTHSRNMEFHWHSGGYTFYSYWWW